MIADSIDGPIVKGRLPLDELYRKMKKMSKLQVRCAEGFDDYTKDGGVFHEAGFDAFVTGCAFAFMKEEFGDEVIEENVNQIRLTSKRRFNLDFSQDEDRVVNKVRTRFNYLKRGFFGMILQGTGIEKKKAAEIVGDLQGIYGDLSKRVRVQLHGTSGSAFGSSKFHNIIVDFDEEM